MVMLIIGVLTVLLSVNLVGIASQSGYLNSAWTRSFGAVGTQLTSATFLTQYTNFETFIIACLEGYVGTPGYIFIVSLALLALVWINNIYEYRQAIM